MRVRLLMRVLFLTSGMGIALSETKNVDLEGRVTAPPALSPIALHVRARTMRKLTFQSDSNVSYSGDRRPPGINSASLAA